MYTPVMERIKEVELRTTGYSFTVEVFKDGGEFVAKLIGFTPPLAQPVTLANPGLTYLENTDEEELRDTDQENLLERCRARIRELDGEILTEKEV